MIKEAVQVIGMGQCGNRIGQEFESVGLDVTYVNSDEVDLRGMAVSSAKTILIATTGTGGSPLKGKEILEANQDKFTNFMSSRMDPDKLQLFVVGGGGGTGGGFICPAVKMAKERGFKVMVLYTLPPKILGPLAVENALRVLKNLKQFDMQGLVLADNEYLISRVGLSQEWWKKVNQAIVSQVVSIFDIVRPGKVTHSGLGSIDRGEIMRIIQTGKGETDMRSFLIDLKEFKELDDPALQKKLFEPVMVEGYDYKNTLSYLIGVDVPVKGSYTEEANRIFSLTKKVCGSALSRPGMFADPLLYGSIRVTMVNAGLKIPKVIQSRMNNLKRDEARYQDKVTKGEKVNLDDMGEGFMNQDNFSF